MKTSMKSSIYPFVFKKIVRRECTNLYARKELKQILLAARAEYHLIIARTPDMGGRTNAYIDNIYMGAYLIALYKQMKDTISISQFGEIINGALQKKLAASKKDPLSEKSRQRRIAQAKWAASHQKRYPWIWQLEIKDGVKPDGLYFEFTSCGLCQLCKAEHTPELMRIFCATDYITYGTSGCTLIRTKTLAAGDDCCDFWIRRTP